MAVKIERLLNGDFGLFVFEKLEVVESAGWHTDLAMLVSAGEQIASDLQVAFQVAEEVARLVNPINVEELFLDEDIICI